MWRACAEAGVPIDPSWGVHLTLNRSFAAMPPAETAALADALEASSIRWECRPVSLDVGYFIFEADRLSMTPYASFNLSP